MSMLYNVELKAEALKTQQQKPASQDLASAFFKATQAQAQRSAIEAMKKGRAKIYHPALAPVRVTPPTEELAKEKERFLRLAKTSVSFKPSPEKERVRRTELAKEEVKLPTLGAPDFITIAGYQIKTVYLIAGIALVVVVALALAMK